MSKFSIERNKLVSALTGLLSFLALSSFVAAVMVYCLFARTDDIGYILPLFFLPLLHFLLGWWQPTSVSRFSHISSSVSLLVIGCCWLWLGLCRTAAKGGTAFFPAKESLYEWAYLLSTVSLVVSFGLLVTVWITIVRLVQNSSVQAGAESKSHRWHEELRKSPNYSLILLFATLWQVICLLGFSLALHDQPAGRGLRSAGEHIELGSLVFRANSSPELVQEHAENTSRLLKDIVEQWSSRGAASRASLLLTLPPGSHLRSDDSWGQVEQALSFIEGEIGNYAVEIQIVHGVQSASVSGGNAEILARTIQLSASETHEPQLLDYLYFMTSTLVTTGYCDLVPVSNYAKLLCTVANIYEVFFTVVFFSIIVSVLLAPEPGGKGRRSRQQAEEPV